MQKYRWNQRTLLLRTAMYIHTHIISDDFALFYYEEK